MDKAIAGCVTDEVPEIQSLGRTLSRWRTEILNHHTTGASNGRTEGLNLVIKKVKRAGHGFRKFDNYRLSWQVLIVEARGSGASGGYDEIRTLGPDAETVVGASDEFVADG